MTTTTRAAIYGITITALLIGTNALTTPTTPTTHTQPTTPTNQTQHNPTSTDLRHRFPDLAAGWLTANRSSNSIQHAIDNTCLDLGANTPHDTLVTRVTARLDLDSTNAARVVAWLAAECR